MQAGTIEFRDTIATSISQHEMTWWTFRIFFIFVLGGGEGEVQGLAVSDLNWQGLSAAL